MPSIETGSSDALVGSLRRTIQRDVYGDLEQSSYPQFAVESRRHNPELRQGMSTEDSSHHKRFRKLHEDDLGRSRILPYHEQRLFVPASQADSHLMSASSVHPRNSFVEPPRMSQPGQGLFRVRQPPLAELVPEYRMPMYDAVVDSGFSPPSSSHPRRSATSSGIVQQRNLSHISRQKVSTKAAPDNAVDMRYSYRPIADIRTIEHEKTVRHVDLNLCQRGQIRQFPLPNFSAANTFSHSNEIGLGSVTSNQAFNRNSSQSRADPCLLQDGEGSRFSARSYRNVASPSGVSSQQYEDTSSRLSTGVRHKQAQSEVRYVQRHK